MLNPRDGTAYRGRGWAHYVKGERDAAIDDYDHAIAIDPKYESAYFDRGLAHLYAGLLTKALADLEKASELSPKWAYSAIWVDIVNKRTNLPSRLVESAKQIDMTRWPAAVVSLYLGKMTPAEVLSAADDVDPDKKNQQVCEAQFYIGELALQRGARDEAIRLFKFAAANCPFDSAPVERAAASAELRALDLSHGRRVGLPPSTRPSGQHAKGSGLVQE